jgi:AcrR family transcriptional regulator
MEYPKRRSFGHFPTKRVLFEAVIARIAARWSEHVDAISITERKPRDWLRAFGIRALRWILSDEALFVGRMAIAWNNGLKKAA